MADYITLLGAEQVQSAANTMRAAAEEMSRAAGSIEYALRQHQMAMTESLDRFESLLERAKALTVNAEPPK